MQAGALVVSTHAVREQFWGTRLLAAVLTVLTNADSISHRAVSASHCRLLRDGALPSLNIPKFNLFEHSVFAVQHRKSSKSNKLHLSKYK